MTVLGEMQPDPLSLILGTGYHRFASPTGIDGLARVHRDCLEILAVHARAPGQGQFRAFIAQAKQEYALILVWEVWNPLLDEVLPRYGFRPHLGIDPLTGELLTGYCWKREKDEGNIQGR